METTAILELVSIPRLVGGHWIAQWSAASKTLIKQAMRQLATVTKPYLHATCCHLKGNGGVKGAVRWIKQMLPQYTFVARFDVDSYYQSMDHAVLGRILADLRTSDWLQTIVAQYLSVPDLHRTGVGMLAGGSLSPLLGALYLLPLDQAMHRHCHRRAIFYVRFMDDLLILGKNRSAFRSAIKTVYAVTESLGLRLHREQKRFIGRTYAGFDFLGYRIHPVQKLRPSQESLRRLVERARQLYEQGGDQGRLCGYVSRWVTWLRGGLTGLVSLAGGIKRYLVYVLKALNGTEKNISNYQRQAVR